MSNNMSIAVIGLAGRFPKAADVEAFWETLCEGKEGITFFSDDELLAAGLSPEEFNHPEYVKARAVLKDVDLFDADHHVVAPDRDPAEPARGRCQRVAEPFDVGVGGLHLADVGRERALRGRDIGDHVRELFADVAAGRSQVHAVKGVARLSHDASP